MLRKKRNGENQHKQQRQIVLGGERPKQQYKNKVKRVPFQQRQNWLISTEQYHTLHWGICFSRSGKCDQYQKGKLRASESFVKWMEVLLIECMHKLLITYSSLINQEYVLCFMFPVTNLPFTISQIFMMWWTSSDYKARTHGFRIYWFIIYSSSGASLLFL